MKNQLQVFVNASLKQMLESKELKRYTAQYTAQIDTIMKLPPDQDGTPLVVQLCQQVLQQSKAPVPLQLHTFDLLSKLLQYDSQGVTAPHAQAIVDLITQQQVADDKLQLQVYKCLQNGIVNQQCQWHSQLLLKAVRAIYNAYLLAHGNQVTAAVAQSTLSQCVQTIFSRVTVTAPGDYAAYCRSALSHAAESSEEIAASIVKEVIQQVVVVVGAVANGRNVELEDAHCLFGALCRLSMKPLPDDASNTSQKQKDVTLIAMRSKILALELLHVIVREHFPVVSSLEQIRVVVQEDDQIPLAQQQQQKATTTTTTFIEAIQQQLCPSLTTNAVSLVPEILERSLDIYVQLMGVRHHLKREIEVFTVDILLGLLDNAQFSQAAHQNQKSGAFTITYHQKLSLVRHLTRMLQDPHVLVDMYLNYDCDPDALDNMFERVVSILVKILGRQDLKLLVESAADAQSQKSQASTAMASVGLLVGAGADVGTFGVRTQSVSVSTISAGGQRTRAPSTASTVQSTQSATQHQDAKTAVVPVTATLGTLGQERENSLKFCALECTATIVQSLVMWSKGYSAAATATTTAAAEMVADKSVGSPNAIAEDDGAVTPATAAATAAGDFSKFESAKHQKAAIREGAELFNWKYKRGIQHWLTNGCITTDPKSVAHLLLTTPNLNKKMIGEYLGEGDDFNIAVMHAFVEEMNFDGLGFVDALRQFLQSFRLPGEAQKIDRFMLKFAERFHLHNPGVFVNADTSYVLAYSVIMLNTDQYNPQVKKRMSREEFIKNNRGISEGKDLDPKFLEAIFDEIARNEIRMKDEEPKVLKKGGSGDFELMSNRQKREALALVTEQITTRTVAATKKQQGTTGTRSPFHVARHPEHARSMMEFSWIPVLAGVSAALQEADMSDMQSSQLALMAMKSAVVLCCAFPADLALARNAFVSTLTKYAHVVSAVEFLTRHKSVLAISCLLDCGYLCGDGLGDAWSDVLRCVSNLERVVGRQQDMASGIVPGVGVGAVSGGTDDGKSKKSTDATRQFTQQENIAIESTAQTLLVQMDRIFTVSNRLSNTGIVEFVRNLCAVSLEEIQQSTSSTTLTTIPRMYSLTKLVEISYYNMNRIRLEWSNIWAILGEHFNLVGCHANQHVAFFCVDSLRQLSIKFLEKEELANFKFQKDFLRPFEHIISNNGSVVIKDMVLRCLHQLVQSKAHNIKSGWKAIFAALNRAARDAYESIVVMSFDTMKLIYSNGKYMDSLVSSNTFPDYVACLVEFARSRVNARVSLQSVELLNQSIPKVLLVMENLKREKTAVAVVDLAADEALPATVKSSTTKDDPIMRLWFPIYFGFYEMIMTCELEVRTRALKYLFETLKANASTYTTEFWDVISRGVLFPIFDDLKLTRSEKRKFENKEDMTVWLNTTLIQALRQLIDLVSFSFVSLEGMMLDGVLDLIKVCFGVPQENETLAKIGSSCLQQLVEFNVHHMTSVHWDKVCATIAELFETTTAHMLFDNDFMNDVYAKAEATEKNSGQSSASDAAEQSTLNLSQTETTQEVQRTGPRRQLKKDFQQIIVKSVLQLQIIQTASDILSSVSPVPIYRYTQSKYLMQIMDCLEASYNFASDFNSDMPFRVALYKIGFMNQLPNLLKQETTAVHCLLTNLFRVFDDVYGSNDLESSPLFDIQKDRLTIVDRAEQCLVRTSLKVIKHYNSLEPQVKQRNIATWSPVVTKILSAFAMMNDDKFKQHIPEIYSDILTITAKHEMNAEMKQAVFACLARVDRVMKISRLHKQSIGDTQ